MKKAINILRLPVMLLLFSSMLMLSSSCGNDEPDWLIGYYLSIDSQVRLSLSDEDEGQGTASSNTTADVLSNTVRNLRSALLDAYPEDTRKGNDAAVLTACDKIYNDYKEAYADKEGYTVCVVTLYRTKKEGNVVKESTPLKTYHFGILPIGIGM